MKRIDCATTCFLLLTVGVVRSTFAAVDSRIEALHAAVLQWLDEVQFAATYTFRSGYALSKEKALAGEIMREAPHDTLMEYSASGVFNKLGKRIRYSRDQQPLVMDPAHPSRISHGPYDEVSNGVVDLTYLPFRKAIGSQAIGSQDVGNAGIGNSVYIGKRHEELQGRLAAGISSRGALSPLSIAKGYPRSPFSIFIEGAQYYMDGIEADFKMEESGQDHLVVTVDYALGHRQEHTREPGRENRHVQEQGTLVARYWLEPSPPVVVEIASREHSRGTTYETYCQAFDFVRCPGGMVARTVRQAQKLRQGSKYPWSAIEWKSTDLGNRPPTDEDFVVSIPPAVQVIGLKYPPRGKVRRLDVNKISLDDLGQRRRAQVAPVATGTVAGSWAARSFVLGGIILAVIVFAFVVMRRRVTC